MVATLPWTIGSSYLLSQLAQVAFLALLVSSVNLSLGYAGELSLGQVAVAAVSAYTAAYVAIHLSSNIAVTMSLGVLAGLVAGLVIGAPGLRLGAWTLAVVTLFGVILIPNAVNLFPSVTGGTHGQYAIPRATLFGRLLDADDVFALTMIVLGAWTIAVRNLVRSRHGAALRALRASPVLSTSVGISTYRFKLFVHLIAAIPAAAAGTLFLYRVEFVNASPFSFSLVVGVMAASQLGGPNSVVFGPLLGAVILQFGPMRSSRFADASLLIYGLSLVIAGLLLPRGLSGLAESWWARMMASRRGARTVALAQTSAAGSTAKATGALRSIGATPARTPVSAEGQRLELREITRSFGGVRAVDTVTLAAEPGQVTALIGGNGSGKTTLLNLASGYLRPDAGMVFLGAEPIHGRPAAALAAAGLRRTFQTPIMPEGLSTAEVVAAGRYRSVSLGVMAAVVRTPRFGRVHVDDHARAVDALRACQLDDHADVVAASLPLGQRRLVEVARAITADPHVLLLDEPAAGLEDEEVAALVAIVRQLREAGLTIVLIEHNFDVVWALADDVYVLDRGVLVAHGTPSEVAAEPVVIERYFGGRRHEAASSELRASL